MLFYTGRRSHTDFVPLLALLQTLHYLGVHCLVQTFLLAQLRLDRDEHAPDQFD